MQILGETNIDFISFRKIAFAVSLVVIIIGLSSIIIKGGLKLGLDFTGGVEIQINFEKPLQVAQIREALSKVGLGRSVIQSYGNPKENTFLVRYHLEKISQDMASAIISYRKEKGRFKNIEELKKIPEIEGLGYENLSNVFTTNPEEQDKININTASMETLASIIDDINSRNIASKIKEALDEKLGKENPFEILSINLIGPKVSRELQRNALLAVTFGLIGMLIYIAWRFEFRFALGAVAALVHDVFITVGALSLGGFEFTLPIIAALLTIVGYSLNDTIVIYDRIRENIKTLRKRKLPPKEVINLSINQSLSRTLITSLTTFIVVLVLFLWGGEPLKGFTFAMLIGVIVGTYSSDFIAAPIVYSWEKIKKRRR